MIISKLLSKYSSATVDALKNTNWILLEKVLSVPVGLILSIVLARYLGTEGYGVYSYLFSIVMLVIPFTSLGLNALVTKEIVNNPSQEGTILGSAFAGRFLGTAIGATVLLVFAYFENDFNRQLLIILAFSQLLTCFTLFDFWFQAKMMNKYAVMSRVLAIYIGLAVKFTIVIMDLGLFYIALTIGLDFILAAMTMGVFFRRCARNIRFSFQGSYFKKLLSQSYWLIFSSIAAAVNLKVDQIMLGNMISATEVGLYAVAARVSEVWYFIPTAVASAFFPLLLKVKSSNLQEYTNKIQRLNDMLLGLAILIIVPVILLAEVLLRLLFGDEFGAAAAILHIHILAGAFIFMRALLSKWLIAEGLLKFSFISHGIGACANVVLNFYFIPKWGGVGAAWASLLSYSASSYLALFVSSKTRPMAWVMTKSLIYPIRYLPYFRK